MSNKLTYVLKNGSNYRQEFDLTGYDDRIDINSEVSLFEYGIIRQSKTGKTLLWHKTLDHEKIEESGYITLEYISEQDVRDALKNIDKGYYDFIGSDRGKILSEINNDPGQLADIIHSISQWNGGFCS